MLDKKLRSVCLLLEVINIINIIVSYILFFNMFNIELCFLFSIVYIYFIFLILIGYVIGRDVFLDNGIILLVVKLFDDKEDIVRKNFY